MSADASAQASATPAPSATELASLAAKAFAGAGASVGQGAAALAAAGTAQPGAGAGSQSAPAGAGAAAPGDARAQTPAAAGAAAGAGAAQAPESAAKPQAGAAIPAGEAPTTILSDKPLNTESIEATRKEVADKAAAEAAKPTYTLAPISKRLSPERVAEIDAFAKKHQLTEAQAKQVLAREDMAIAEAYDASYKHLVSHPEFGGAHIDATVATTKQFLQLLPAEDRALIANSPLANHVTLHRIAKIVMALVPQEDYARRATPRPAEPTMTPGQAWLSNPKIRA